MSVPNQTPYIIYNANGMTTVFPFEFYIIAAGDIQVSINGTIVTSGFSVSGAGNVSGGDVVFMTPPAAGSVVMLERVVPTYRLTDYQDNGDLLADTINKDFDRLWMAIQHSSIYLGLALRRPLLGGPFDAEGYRISNGGDPVGKQDFATKNYVDSSNTKNLSHAIRTPEVIPQLPAADERSNKLLAFNAAGNPITVLPQSGSASDVMIELAKPTGASHIGVPPGGTLADIVTPIADVSKISTLEFHDGLSYRLAAWRPMSAPIANAYGGGEFYYSASTPRSSHNGGTVIDVTVPYNGDVAYLAGTGTAGGNGCLIRKGVASELNMSWFGAVPNTESTDSWASAQKCIDESRALMLQAFIPFSIVTTKPLVLRRATTLYGVSKYKSFIYKVTDNKSGLPNIKSPDDAGGVSVSYDVDAVIIICPDSDGEYATWIKLRDFSVEKNNSPNTLPMPLNTFGIYAPYMNLSQSENCQAYKVDYAFYSEVCWMTQINQWRAFNVNHNIHVVKGGTSLVLQNVWVQDCYSTAYYFRDVGYSNFIQMSVDKIYRSDSTDIIYPYWFNGCTNCKAVLSIEETEGCGIVSVSTPDGSSVSTNMDITIYAGSGIRKPNFTTPKPAVNIYNSDVTFSNSTILWHPGTDGNNSGGMFVHGSNVTAINTPYFRDNFFASDDNVSRLTLIGNSFGFRGRVGAAMIETTLGADLRLGGVWDKGGRIQFLSDTGTLYGTMFANSAGDLYWKKLGTPVNNSDGTKLN